MATKSKRKYENWQCMQMACLNIGANLHQKHYEQLSEIYEAMKTKGGSLTINEISDIKFRAEERHKKTPNKKQSK